MELNRSITIKTKEGYNVKDVETFLTTVGSRIDSSSGNTINATISSLLFNHINAHAGVASVTDNTFAPAPKLEEKAAPVAEVPISSGYSGFLGLEKKKHFWDDK